MLRAAVDPARVLGFCPLGGLRNRTEAGLRDISRPRSLSIPAPCRASDPLGRGSPRPCIYIFYRLSWTPTLTRDAAEEARNRYSHRQPAAMCSLSFLGTSGAAPAAPSSLPSPLHPPRNLLRISRLWIALRRRWVSTPGRAGNPGYPRGQGARPGPPAAAAKRNKSRASRGGS